MRAAVVPLHPMPPAPAGLDVLTAVTAAFALSGAYRTAELAGRDDITTATVHRLVDEFGADAVQFALQVSADRCFEEATELGRYVSTREAQI